MSQSVYTSPRITPDQVMPTLKKHMLVDGFKMVIDLAKSHGPYLYDTLQDRELLDLFTCFSTSPLGYNHPRLMEKEFKHAVFEAAVNKPSNSDLYTTHLAEFVEALSRTLPEPLSHHLFFISGGALAVENGLKAAFDWKVRKNLAAGRGELGSQILHFRHAFHGRSGYTLSLTNTDPTKTRYFPKFDWPRISNPHLRFPVTDAILEEVERGEKAAIEEIKQALLERRHDIAGLIIEPIQGEGGDNHFRGEFLRALRELADEEELLLIFDEVQTGFATTGKWWCCEHFDVLPDILCFGKKTQVCGIAASHRLDEVDSVFHVSSRINSTWGGNLADMIRCRRYVEIIEEEGLVENAARVGEVFLSGLRELEERFPTRVSNARGRGLFLAFDLPDRETREQAVHTLEQAGVFGLRSGERAIRFRPPVSLTEAEAREGLVRVAKALEATL